MLTVQTSRSQARVAGSPLRVLPLPGLQQLAHWLPAHSLANSRNLHLLTMATGILVSLLTGKTELVVRGVYGAGKTQYVALLAAYFALRGHQAFYASRENTTITAMAAFVHTVPGLEAATRVGCRQV